MLHEAECTPQLPCMAQLTSYGSPSPNRWGRANSPDESQIFLNCSGSAAAYARMHDDHDVSIGCKSGAGRLLSGPVTVLLLFCPSNILAVSLTFIQSRA